MSLSSSPKVASAGQPTNLHLHNNKGMTVQVLVERSNIVTFSGTPEVNGFPGTGGWVEQLRGILCRYEILVLGWTLLQYEQN